ncbi:MAG: LppX_LprAFG lipoprotein [Roseiflexaceae bacterium]|nr:LppX_LprAFG lipoprotein [Roseiflexaceae bacterium]
MTLFLLLLMLTACAGPGSVFEPTPTPAEYIARAGQATQAAQSFNFAIELSGKSVYSDAAGLFAIRSITGSVKRPDGALAILKVKSAIGIAEVRTVSLAGKQYFTNPLTRQWQCLAPGTAFDPTVLFDSQRGIGALFQQGIERPANIGQETIDGRIINHLRGTIAAERLRTISGNALGAGPVALDLWADARTNRIVKIVMVDTATDTTNPTTWTMTISEYDAAVEVRAPVEC